VPKSVELEHRIGRIETTLRELQDVINMYVKRATALQAQVDHLTAKIRGN